MFNLPSGNLYFQFYHNTVESQVIRLQSELVSETKADYVTETKPTTLGAFIHAEMVHHNMTAREFADFVGVTHSTINKFLNHGISNTYGGKQVGDPSIEFLVKLSKATHTDICTLVALVAPDVSNTNARAHIIAERISRLPPEQQDMMDSFLLGLSFKGAKKDE